jgi:hypothetical protein
VAESVGLMTACYYILEKINIKSCDGIIPSIQMASTDKVWRVG